VELGWLPSFGRSGAVEIGGWHTSFLSLDGFKALILPGITLGLYQMTLIMRLVRAEMLEVLGQDYIRFARARGLPMRKIYYYHALKNTLVPVITIIGLQFGSIIAFSIITESVFQWPGLGLMFINSIYYVDIPVMSAYLVLVSLVFVTINLLVDILYQLIDPRLSDAQTGAN
jgi:peptide/nickel transport system permease protein